MKPTPLQLIVSAFANKRRLFSLFTQSFNHPLLSNYTVGARGPTHSQRFAQINVHKLRGCTALRSTPPLQRKPNCQQRFRLVTAFYFLIFLSFNFSFAQGSLEQLRQHLANGYYASATQISGPLAIQENPDNPEAYFLYSKALYYADNPSGARVQFDKALSLIGDAPPEYTHLEGLITAAEGNLGQAVTLLETAFLKSQDYLVAMDWGRTAWQAGDFDTALKAFQGAASTEQGKQEVGPYLNQGRILQLARGDMTGAITAYQNALGVFDANDPGGPAPPSVVEINFRLGEIYESLGDKPLAKTYYEAALGLDRNYTPAKNALDRLVRNP